MTTLGGSGHYCFTLKELVSQITTVHSQRIMTLLIFADVDKEEMEKKNHASTVARISIMMSLLN